MNRAAVKLAIVQPPTAPIGATTCAMVKHLPRELKGQLPGPEEIAKLRETDE